VEKKRKVKETKGEKNLNPISILDLGNKTRAHELKSKANK